MPCRASPKKRDNLELRVVITEVDYRQTDLLNHCNMKHYIIYIWLFLIQEAFPQ